MKVRELITVLGFEVDDKALKALDNNVDKVKAGIVGLSASVIGAGLALFGFLKTSANSADQILKLANSAGVGVEEMQRLGYAAQLSGASMEELAGGLKFLSKNMYEAAKNPGGEMAKTLQRMGVRALDANGKLRKTSDVVIEVSDRVAKMTNPTEKAAAAMSLFGKSGGGLVEFLERGGDRIRELSAEMDAFDGVLDRNQINTLGEFNDSLDRTFMLLNAIKNKAAVELAPAITKVFDGFRQFLVVNKDIIKANLTGFIKGLTSFLRTMWKFIRAAGDAFAYLAGKIGGAEKLTKAFLYTLAFLSSATVVAGIIGMAKAFKALAVAINMAALKPMLIASAIVAAAALIFLVVEDIVGYFNGKQSVTGVIVEGFSKLWESVKESFIGFKDWMLGETEDFISKIGEMFLKLHPGLNFLSVITGGGLPAFDFFKSFGKDGKTETMSEEELSKFGGGSGKDQTNPVINFLKSFMAPPTGPTGAAPLAPGLTPTSAPVPGKETASVNITAPITVTVPPGTDPGMVGERVEAGIGGAFSDMLRQAHRATT